MIQSGSELLRQQGIAEGFRNVGSGQAGSQQNPLRAAIQVQQQQPGSQPHVGLKSSPSGLVGQEGTQAALQNYIPKNRDQLMARAADLYDQNRQLYPNPESALQAAAQEDQQNQAISQAHQANRASQIGVENRLRGGLKDLRTEANANVPENVYQQVENDVLDKVAQGKIKETEAIKEGQKELDKISRQYKALETVGNTDYILRDTNDIKRNLKQIREDFKERKDLENLADSYISKNGLSPGKAYYLAYPPSEIKELNNALSKIKPLGALNTPVSYKRGYVEKDPEFISKKTLEIAPDLAKAMGREGSPLAIGEVLNSLGYDKDVWLDYVGRNRNDLNLGERQGRELGKPKSTFPTLNDNFLFWSAGLEKLVEQ